jgi:hypothetical protein
VAFTTASGQGSFSDDAHQGSNGIDDGSGSYEGSYASYDYAQTMTTWTYLTGALQLKWDSTDANFRTRGMTGSTTPNAPEGLNMAYPNHVQFYEYCPQEDGHVEADTCQGTSYDSYLAFFLKDATMTDHPSGLVSIQQNDDACSTQSRIDTPVSAGKHYFVAGRFDAELDYQNHTITRTEIKK